MIEYKKRRIIKGNENRLNWVLILILYSQIASTGLLNFMRFGGRTIHAYTRYIIYFVAVISLVGYMLKNRKQALKCIVLLAVWVSTIIYGYVRCGNLEIVMIESSRYVTLVFLWFWVNNSKTTIKRIIRMMYLAMPFLLITTLLSSFGYLSGLSDESGAILRSSSDVDGTFAVVGAIVAFHEINREQNRKNQYINYIEFVIAVVVVAFSMSRARILALAICLFFYFVVTLNCKKASRIKKMVPLFILFALCLFLFSDTFRSLINQISIRFMGMSDSVNIIRRRVEIEKHLELIRQNLFTGVGWGYFSRLGIKDHCSYTAIIAYLGVIIGTSYILFLVHQFTSSSIRAIRRREYNYYHLASTSALALLLLALGNMSFNKTGGIIAALVIYASVFQERFNHEGV